MPSVCKYDISSAFVILTAVERVLNYMNFEEFIIHEVCILKVLESLAFWKQPAHFVTQRKWLVNR